MSVSQGCGEDGFPFGDHPLGGVEFEDVISDGWEPALVSIAQCFLDGGGQLLAGGVLWDEDQAAGELAF